ncbi:MAG TPA: translocation protein TolB [Polyangia bacterium]|jgi:TolB protein
MNVARSALFACLAVAITTPLLVATTAHAQQPLSAGGDEDLPHIRITDPGRDLFRLALPTAQGDGDLAKQALDGLNRDLDITGLFRLLDPTSFPSQLQAEGLGFSSALWSQVGAQGVAKMKSSRVGGGVETEARLYVLGRGDAPVISRAYRAGDVRDTVHLFANDIVEYFTGQRGVFGSRIAVALSGTGSSHEIASLEMDGGRVSVLTKMGADCLLPAFSPSGNEVAFTSFLRNNPDLWIVPAGGGRARRLSQKQGLNTGAAWSADGRSIALTLSFEGNSEIYRINASDGAIQSKLTSSPSIDSSPSFSPDGAQIAFVSNRQGTPQIFVMPSSGGGAKRVTFQGKYNQTPRWNPRPDKPLIAFTGRDERGVFDIFILDMRTGKIDRVTQSKGSNMDPAWSPDGRLLVYASSRGGLFVANPETRHEVQIWRGAAASPSWGPAPAAPRGH